MSTPLGCTTSQLMREKRPLSQKKLCSSSLLPILAMPAMRKNVSPSTLFYFPSQVRIHPQIRSQITRLQSKYSLDLDPHSGVTQPKLSRATQTTNSLLSKPSSTPLCVQNILGLASLNTDTPSLFGDSIICSLPLLPCHSTWLPRIILPPPGTEPTPSRCGRRLHPPGPDDVQQVLPSGGAAGLPQLSY